MTGHGRAIVDANILAYLSDSAHAFHSGTLDGVRAFRSAGWALCIIPQTDVEFWSVSTRPVEVGGLGLSPREAAALIDEPHGVFEVLSEEVGVHRRWRSLVERHEVRGWQVHDTRIVAAMDVYGIATILTKNLTDFRRYPWISAIDPAAPRAT